MADDDPLLVGAKETVSCALWPEFSVRGNDAPEIAYCELLLAAEETVTLPPLALIVEV